MVMFPDYDPGPTLYGLSLRAVLLLALYDARRPLDMAELARAVERAGFRVEGRPSKAISDALRAELDRGRVRRVDRGVYTASRVPRATVYRMRQRVERRRRGEWMGHDHRHV